MYEVTLCPVTRLMLCVVAHIALCAADAGGEKCHELLDDVGCPVSMRVCGFSLGMGIEDVVHHRQAEAAHQVAVEE